MSNRSSSHRVKPPRHPAVDEDQWHEREQEPAVHESGNKRNSAVTRQRILQVAMREFAEHGYSGARIERISQAAAVNVRMIYHYFGGKDDLYLKVLEEAYRRIRTLEQKLPYDNRHPLIAMRNLVELTFDFLSEDPYFVRLVMSENLMMGESIRKSEIIPVMTLPLAVYLERTLQAGQREGLFHDGIDSENLYISILSLCFIHVSNKYTLSCMFRKDISHPKWLSARKTLVTDIVIRYLTSTS